MQWISLRQAQEDAGGTVTVNQHWYLTEDRSRVVEEGHPDSRWLWASPGTVVKLADAIRLGAVKVEPAPDAVAELVEDGMDPEKVAKAVAENPIELDEPDEDAVEAEAPETATDDAPAEEKKAKQAPNKAAKKATNKAADKAADKAEDK